MKLKDLIRGLDIQDLGGLDPEIEIRSLEEDSRKVKEGSLFVAVKGYITDGHSYLAQAKERGVALALVEEVQDIDLPQIQVKDSRQALADMACNFYDHPSKKMRVVGITATNGKTSTAFMLERILQEAGQTVGMVGTVRLSYPGVSIPSLLTTPGALELQKHLAGMVQAGVDTVVMEVSSSALELDRVRGVDFDLVTFNNLSHEHIDQHGSYEKYVDFKSRLVRWAGEEAASLINLDYPEIGALKDQTASQVFSYSLEGGQSEILLRDLDLSTGLGSFVYTVPEEISRGGWTLPRVQIPISLGVAGYHSVMNSLVAISLALLMGIEPGTIKDGLEAFRGVERRFELIYDEDFKVLDDHFANERNIQVTLQTLEKMDYENLHILYAIRGSRGVSVNEENAQVLASWLDRLKPKTLLASLSMDVVADKDRVRPEEEEVFSQVMEDKGVQVPIINDLEPAIYQVLEEAGPGDVVLLAGCQGMDPGARFAWSYLIDRGLVKDKEDYIKRIETRVC